MSPYYQSAQCSPFIYSTVDPTISLVAPRHLNGIEIAITPVCDEFAERITSLGDTERGASWTINLGSRHLGFDLSVRLGMKLQRAVWGLWVTGPDAISVGCRSFTG